GFIADCKEKYLPNTFIHSAYNVFGFEISSSSVNPLLNKFQELNWSFIISLIVSFVVLLLTFDTISGEKEAGTLSATLSNSISRGMLLLGKYVSVILSVMIMILTGVLISIIILLISHLVTFSIGVLTEILSFAAVSFLFVSLIAAVGILSSVIVRSSNVSLLISLVFWLIFIVVIPNSSIFLAKNVFTIEKSDTVNKRISEAKADINRNAPPGSWSSNSSNPFYPRHELRAANQTNLMNAEKRIQNEYYSDMFRQFEKTRMLTMVSPVCLYEYMNEAVVGGGYFRLRKVWSDLHNFQPMFLQFFKDKDANDPDSPHWYNPYEDYSTTRKPVSFEEVPLSEEKRMSFADRFSAGWRYLLITAFYALLIFFLTFVLFVRYDVR
ncbi:ABC transporter permease subunit, partial [bacterium]|nr:ABC transporter permease subunit [bacterium]